MTLEKLKAGAHVHLMGICGTAMASLAGLLKDLGYSVTGSDANPYPPMSTQIEKLGIPLKKGYSAQNLTPRPDFVVVGNVISAHNPEAMELQRLQLPFTSLPQAMGNFVIGNKQSVVVAGTHGKTTTTALMSWILETAGLHPGFLIGGVPKNFPYSFRLSNSDFFVIEGDEYDTAYFDKVPKFVHYKPQHVILTSVEFDHADIYSDLEAVKKSFRCLLDLIPAQGHLIACADQPHLMELLQEKVGSRSYPIVTYGLQQGDVRLEVLPSKQNKSCFQLKITPKIKSLFNIESHTQDDTIGPFVTDLSGEHNLLNATAAIVLSLCLKVSLTQVQQSLLSFMGVKRRQEILGSPAGVLVIEDFAHHPTAVRETLKGLKTKYLGQKIFAVFEPRSATSRRKVFQKDYAHAFSFADEVILAQAFDQTKIEEANRFSSDELVQDLQSQNQRAFCYSDVAQIVVHLQAQARSGDVIVIMSNGGFDGIYQKLLLALESVSKNE